MKTLLDPRPAAFGSEPLHAIRRPYCLRCYGALERAPGASAPCKACGFVNVLADQRLFWTREPALVRAEASAKLSIVLLLGGIFWFMLRGMDMRFGMGQGYAIGFPIVIGAVLWQTAEKLTRRKPYFRAALFWFVLPLVVAVPLAVVALWPSGPETRLTEERRLLQGLVAGGLAVLGFGLRYVCLRLDRWKTERVARAQARVQGTT